MDNGRRRIDYRAMDEKDLIRIGTVVAKAIFVALVYALPAILATWWRQRRQEKIALLNLVLGWTGIGWLALLAYVVQRRMRGSRSPHWRYKLRGVAATEHQSRQGGAQSASLGAELTRTASFR